MSELNHTTLRLGKKFGVSQHDAIPNSTCLQTAKTATNVTVRPAATTKTEPRAEASGCLAVVLGISPLISDDL
jgi:hypothetical protein